MSGPATIALRQEEPGDATAIREIHRLAFGGDAEAGMVDAARAAGVAVLSMVAVDGDHTAAAGPVVAHVLFTRVTVTVEGGEDNSLVGLAPVAVLPSRQGRGVGTMLIEAALERLRAESHPAVVVVGDPGYYPRFGFLPGSRWGLRWEVDAPDEVFMVTELSPGALADIRGVVRFRPEFGGV